MSHAGDRTLRRAHLSCRDRLDMLLLILLHSHFALPNKVEPFQRAQDRLVAVDVKYRAVPLGRAHLGHPRAHLQGRVERRIERVLEIAVPRSGRLRRAFLLEERGSVDRQDLAQGAEDVPELSRRGQCRGGRLRARCRFESG